MNFVGSSEGGRDDPKRFESFRNDFGRKNGESESGLCSFDSCARVGCVGVRNSDQKHCFARSIRCQNQLISLQLSPHRHRTSVFIRHLVAQRFSYI